MWHVFYKVYLPMNRRAPARSYAVCGTEAEAEELRKQCRRKLKVQCWIEFIALRADLDG